MNEFDTLFEALKNTEPPLQKEIRTHTVIEDYPKGVFVVEQEKYIKWLAIVIRGTVRVLARRRRLRNFIVLRKSS